MHHKRKRLNTKRKEKKKKRSVKNTHTEMKTKKEIAQFKYSLSPPLHSWILFLIVSFSIEFFLGPFIALAIINIIIIIINPSCLFSNCARPPLQVTPDDNAIA